MSLWSIEEGNIPKNILDNDVFMSVEREERIRKYHKILAFHDLSRPSKIPRWFSLPQLRPRLDLASGKNKTNFIVSKIPYALSKLKKESREFLSPPKKFLRGSPQRSSLRMSSNGSQGTPSEGPGTPAPSPGPYSNSSYSGSPYSNGNNQCLSIDTPVGTSHSHCGSLSRSATTSRVCTQPPARAFGGTVYMMKEDHEKERARWQGKIEEIEMRLAESEMLNSDMNQIKAELNKKIVELEKNQKPLIDQNRKVSEKNKNLVADIKKLDQKLSHTQDDFLSMKDAHERVTKENNLLKEKRTFPEKLEELDRYRNQVLEYSKCITALRQSGVEKDRRYEMLVQKFKRLRKCIRKGDMDDDRQSTVGSTCSDESFISLDTITEDLEDCVNQEIETNYQALYRENEELQRALAHLKISAAFSDENMLRDQLTFAHSTIAQQQIIINSQNDRASIIDQLRATIISQQETIKQLEANVDKLTSDLAAACEEKELIEFQMIETENDKEEMERSLNSEKLDQECETEEIFDQYDEPSVSALKKLNKNESTDLKEKLVELRKARNLKLAQRQTVADTTGYVNALEYAVAEAASMGSSQTHEWASREEDYVDRINKLQTELEKSKEKAEKHDQIEIVLEEVRKNAVDTDRARQHLNEEVNRLSKEMGKLQFNSKTKDETIESLKKNGCDLLEKTKAELEKAQQRIATLESENEKMATDLRTVIEEYAKFRDDQRPSIRTDLERRYEETKYKLNVALERVHDYEVILDAAKKRDSSTSLADALQAELLELKEYNCHLERQFQSQTDIIETMKQRLIQNRIFADFLNKSAEVTTNVSEEIQKFKKEHKDKDMRKMVDNFEHVITTLTKDRMLSTIKPLEISTSHAKVRSFNSADSAGCLSNSSEGITSPEERASDDEWEKREKKSKLCALRRGNDYVAERSASAMSS